MYKFDKETIIPCVDWFRGIVPVIDVREFIDNLGAIDSRLRYENWVETDLTMLNFSKRWCHQDLKSLTFAYNPSSVDNMKASLPTENPNAFILFSLSGDAIRYLGDYTLKLIFKYFVGLEYGAGYKTRCTRLDIALDFFNSENNIIPLVLDACNHFLRPVKHEPALITAMHRDPANWQMFVNVYPDTGETTYGYNIGNHGSSHGMFRVYDKRFECLYGRNRQRGKELVKDRPYWYRAELELHNCGRKTERQWANEAFYNLVANDFNIMALYGKCIDDFFSITDSAVCVNSSVAYSDRSALWLDFVAFLSSDIHFV